MWFRLCFFFSFDDARGYFYINHFRLMPLACGLCSSRLPNSGMRFSHPIFAVFSNMVLFPATLLCGLFPLFFPPPFRRKQILSQTVVFVFFFFRITFTEPRALCPSSLGSFGTPLVSFVLSALKCTLIPSFSDLPVRDRRPLPYISFPYFRLVSIG